MDLDWQPAPAPGRSLPASRLTVVAGDLAGGEAIADVHGIGRVQLKRIDPGPPLASALVAGALDVRTPTIETVTIDGQPWVMTGWVSGAITGFELDEMEMERRAPAITGLLVQLADLRVLDQVIRMWDRNPSNWLVVPGDPGQRLYAIDHKATFGLGTDLDALPPIPGFSRNMAVALPRLANDRRMAGQLKRLVGADAANAYSDRLDGVAALLRNELRSGIAPLT